MERLLQYLDDLDDLCGVFGLAWEKMRRILLRVVSIAMISAAGAAAMNATRALGTRVCDQASTVRV